MLDQRKSRPCGGPGNRKNSERFQDREIEDRFKDRRRLCQVGDVRVCVGLVDMEIAFDKGEKVGKLDQGRRGRDQADKLRCPIRIFYKATW